MMKILIIEDDKFKIERLLDFFKDDTVVLKESFQSGVLELKLNFSEYSYLILDMTIPIWVKGNNDLGGNYDQFGGEKVLKEMKRRKLSLPTILFTMFDVFPTKKGNITFAEIDSSFKRDFEEFYLGTVFYNSSDESWRSEILRLINRSS